MLYNSAQLYRQSYTNNYHLSEFLNAWIDTYIHNLTVRYFHESILDKTLSRKKYTFYLYK
jgi:hypothetical protein